LNTPNYQGVNFACIFAHKRYAYAEKSVDLHATPTDAVGLHHPHRLPCICP